MSVLTLSEVNDLRDLRENGLKNLPTVPPRVTLLLITITFYNNRRLLLSFHIDWHVELDLAGTIFFLKAEACQPLLDGANRLIEATLAFVHAIWISSRIFVFLESF